MVVRLALNQEIGVRFPGPQLPCPVMAWAPLESSGIRHNEGMIL